MSHFSYIDCNQKCLSSSQIAVTNSQLICFLIVSCVVETFINEKVVQVLAGTLSGPLDIAVADLPLENEEPGVDQTEDEIMHSIDIVADDEVSFQGVNTK